VAVDDEGQDARAIDAVVNAPGELASVEGTPLLWDSAHPLCRWPGTGEASILGEDGPWALAGHEARAGSPRAGRVASGRRAEAEIGNWSK
jgi:hypothetical protein